MKTSLQTLTRIQKFKIDEQRKILVEYQNKEDELQQRLDQLNRDFENEKKTSREIGLAADFGAYVKRYLKIRESLENQLAAIRKKIMRLSTAAAKKPKKKNCPTKSRRCLMKSEPMPI